MFNRLKSSAVNTKREKETDLPFWATEEKKKQILSSKLASDRNFSL